MNSFKEIFNNLRKERCLTQKLLAKELNISADSIYNWENGRSEPSIDDLINIAIYFNVSIDFLVGKDKIWVAS